MIHGSDTSVVDENVQTAVGSTDLGKHLAHTWLVGNVEAEMPIVIELEIRRLPAAPDHLEAPGGVRFRQVLANAFSRAGDKDY
jgi:hypothetical protein